MPWPSGHKDMTTRPILGSWPTHIGLALHQASYAVPPIWLLLLGWEMDPMVYGAGVVAGATGVWIPFFFFSHVFATYSILIRAYFSASVSVSLGVVGYLLIAYNAGETGMGQLIQVWSMAPNATQNFMVLVVVLNEAVRKRDYTL